MSFNAANITKNNALDLLREYAAPACLHVICICETFATAESISSAEFSLNSTYQVFRKDRNSGRGGGVCILVRNDIECLDLSHRLNDNDETLAVEFPDRTDSFRLVCAYNSPTGSAETLLSRTRRTLEAIEQLLLDDVSTVIVGDFNMPGIDWSLDAPRGSSPKEHIFVDFCLLNDLSQLVAGATRPRSGTCLDLVLTNSEQLIDSIRVVPPPFRSDHDAVCFTVKVESLLGYSTPKAFCNFKKADYASIERALFQVDWKQFFSHAESVDDMYERLLSLLNNLVRLYVPVQPRRCNRLTSKLEAYLRTINDLHASTSDPLIRDKLYSKLSKASYRSRVLEENALDSSDARSFFNYANNRLRARDSVGPLRVGDRLLVGSAEQSEALKEHFGSVFINSDPAETSSYVHAPMRSPLTSELRFEQHIVYTKLRKLSCKSSRTPDGLPPILLKSLALAMSEPLSLIYERSWNESDVPTVFRHSLITPIPKNKDRSSVDNYRPIAQGSIACIVMERIVVDYLTRHLETTGCMDEHQHGFRKNRSTATQLLEMTQEWGVMLSTEFIEVHCVYFDYSKAFDRVPHHRLLEKMRSHRIPDRLIRWCRAYLDKRTFVVKVRDATSSSAPCTSGVPQGSSLGPLLWAFFMIDMRSYLPQGVRYKLYADDLKVYIGVRETDQANCQLLQRAINGVSRWAEDNSMSISRPKCAVLKVSGPRRARSPFTYTLDGAPIPEVDGIRDLGVLISNDLKFSSHAQSVAKSASRICNMILRSLVVKRAELYIRLYKTLVIPKFSYCSVIWYPVNVGDLELLERVQRRFLRHVGTRCGVPNLELPSIRDLFDNLDEQLYKKILSSTEVSRMFDVGANNLRSACSVRPKTAPRSESVRGLFSWRVTKRFQYLYP